MAIYIADAVSIDAGKLFKLFYDHNVYMRQRVNQTDDIHKPELSVQEMLDICNKPINARTSDDKINLVDMLDYYLDCQEVYGAGAIRERGGLSGEDQYYLGVIRGKRGNMEDDYARGDFHHYFEGFIKEYRFTHLEDILGDDNDRVIARETLIHALDALKLSVQEGYHPMSYLFTSCSERVLL